jgi:hypothetical protein
LKISIYLLYTATLSAIAGPAFATLGGGTDTIIKDHVALKASRRVSTTLGNYSVEEMTTAAATVREYVTPAGVVFGIAWSGISHPDLSVLLGAYKKEYEQALQSNRTPRGKRHSQVASANIVVQKWGHMRGMKGRAYVPGLIPTGVTVDEIK